MEWMEEPRVREELKVPLDKIEKHQINQKISKRIQIIFKTKWR